MSTLPTKRKEQEQAIETRQERNTVAPFVDVYENEDELLLVAELPGVKQEDLHIAFHDDELTIEGRFAQWPEGEPTFLEFEGVDYKRIFKVQQKIDVDKIKATFKQGVASIHLPKAPEMKRRQIQINIA